MWIAEVHRTAHPESQSGSYANVASGVVSMLSPARRSRIGPMWVARTTGRVSNRTSLSLDDSTLGLPSGVVTASHKRADRTLGGSTLGLPSGVLHESHKRVDRTFGSTFGLSSPACSMRATSERTFGSSTFGSPLQHVP